MDLISEGHFGKYSKMKILVLTFLKEVNFWGLSPLKLKISSSNLNGNIIAYKVFYLPIFNWRGGGGRWNTPPPILLRIIQKFEICVLREISCSTGPCPYAPSERKNPNLKKKIFQECITLGPYGLSQKCYRNSSRIG